jgi:CRP-like cAMP-binding protein
MRLEHAIGEIALINNVPRAATVAAQTPTLALLLSTRRTLS